MTVNSYLTNLTEQTIIRDSEKENIKRSIDALKLKLNSHFNSEISDHFIFGSYSRGTILPRNMDDNSDIDYMVVFRDSAYKSQAYLDKLHCFVERYYSRSEIEQSNPTIVLSLNHIRFELVPTIRNSYLQQLQIPAKASDYRDWIQTDPKGFNSQLTDKNKFYNNLLKPLVRLAKYWNVVNQRPFESYSLEQKIVNYSFGNFYSKQLNDYFYEFVESMVVECGDPQWKKDKIERAKKFVTEARNYERQSFLSLAEDSIKRLLPPVN